MRPLLGKLPAVINGALKAILLEGAETGEHYQQVRRHQHIDEVELQDAEIAELPSEVTGVDHSARTGTMETLGCQCNAPCRTC